jgi:hypothetical protein
VCGGRPRDGLARPVCDWTGAVGLRAGRGGRRAAGCRRNASFGGVGAAESTSEVATLRIEALCLCLLQERFVEVVVVVVVVVVVKKERVFRVLLLSQPGLQN